MFPAEAHEEAVYDGTASRPARLKAVFDGILEETDIGDTQDL